MLKKRILLIMPDAHMHKLKIGSFVKSFREAPLTLTTLAAFVDREKFEVHIVDESVDKVPDAENWDLVGISVLTGTACRAYRHAVRFRQKGIPVVLGGVHVTILPHEAMEYADSIVVGMGEESWPHLLNDFYNGQMKAIYNDESVVDSSILLNVPSPLINLQRTTGYVLPYTVQATRGCIHRCDFCSVSAVWKRFYKRPISDVIRDIKALPGNRIAFNDVSLVADVEYAKELFTALIPLKKKWGGLATVLSVQDDELFNLMIRSGCKFLLIGFESFNQDTLTDIRKGFNLEAEYRNVIDKLHSCDVSVQGTLVLGFDEDDKYVFEKTVNRVEELGIDIPRYSIYTPYPGTRLYQRLQKEKRIISYNWEDYDTMHVVFQPKQMTPQELYEGFKWTYKETFKLHKIVKRLSFDFSIKTAINFTGNLAYNIFVKRLYSEERYKKPYGYIDESPLI